MDEPSDTPLTNPPNDAEAPPTPPSNQSASPSFNYSGPGRRRMWLMRNEQWLIYCLPFLVFMVFTQLEPVGASNGFLPIPHGMTSFITYNLYPFIYSLKIILTSLAIIWVWPGYRQFPWKVSWLAVAVGVVGAVLWIAINKGQQLIDLSFLHETSLSSLTKLGSRSGFNPLRELRDNPTLAWSFLAIRFFGLVIIVPIIEEFFLRGFLMRFVIEYEWWNVPFGKMTPLAVAVGIGVPMMMHPQELIAALVWFSMVTWLMYYTKNIWDCVIAHSITNLLMGLWVLYSDDWWLM